MEEMLELQDKAAQLEKDLATKQAEINEKDAKILELTEKISNMTNESAKNASDVRHFRSMMSVLETDKKNLERERDRLLKDSETLNTQARQFANMVETLNKTLQTKEEMLLSKDKQLQKKDEILTEKDAKIEEYRVNFGKVSEEKENYQKEKFTFMEKINKEKLELVEKSGNLEKTLQEKEQKLQKFKEKAKNAEDGLLGSSMEMEKLNENIAKLTQKNQELTAELEKEKATPKASTASPTSETPKIDQSVHDQQIAEYKTKTTELEAKLTDITNKFNELKDAAAKQQPVQKPPEEEDIFGKGTGIYKRLSSLITHFKMKIGNTQRSLRLIVPDLVDLQKNNLLEALNTLQPQILKNIAASVDMTKDGPLVEELKRSNFKLTDFKGGNLFALTVDTNEAALAIFDKVNNTITGVFSNNDELVKLLSQAIMNPFIKGIKLN